MKIDLGGDWLLYLGEGLPIPAVVPGSVYMDLMENSKISGRVWGDNEIQALLEMGSVYEREFFLDGDFLKLPQIRLCCDGLASRAEIIINGTTVGKTDNMHRRYEFDVKPFLLEKANKIRVEFDRDLNNLQRECFAKLPDAGMFRDIYLNGYSDRIGNVYVRQEHRDDEVILRLDADYSGDLDAYLISETWEEVARGYPELTVSEPGLWWPNGYGSQTLYTLVVELRDEEGERLDSVEMHIGLRTVTVSREGEGFAITVNGQEIFAMGADYVPEDCILPRMNDERTYSLLKDCVAANFNCIRVWGGGVYPAEYFYDYCDELGLLVWQDFMFAGSLYELTPEFEQNLRHEISDNVIRLRNHASLAIWCGNSGIEYGVETGEIKASPRQKSHYIQMYEHIFPRILSELDPDRFYWPSSPSSGGAFDEPNAGHRGDCLAGIKPEEFRLATGPEIKSLPVLKTVESFAPPEERNVFSRTMERCGVTAEINPGSMYLYPFSLENLIYATQLVQAENISRLVTYLRRNRGTCMGIFYRRLNDSWPTVSASSVDCMGRWKALHYYAKRFFAPVLISCQTEAAGATLCLSNETGDSVSGKVEWSLREATGQIKEQGEISVTAEPYSSQILERFDFEVEDIYKQYFAFNLRLGRSVISAGSMLFCPPKHFKFQDPKLVLEQDGNMLTVSAEAFAKSVEIYAEDGEAVLSDNFFDLNGDRKTVDVIRGDATSFGVRSVYDIGRE